MTERKGRGIHFDDEPLEEYQDVAKKEQLQKRVTQYAILEQSAEGVSDDVLRRPRRSVFTARKSLFKSSGGSISGAKPTLKFEPTYRIMPTFVFPAPYVREMLKQMLDQKFSTVKDFNFKKIQRDCQQLSISTLTRIKSMNSDRYRLICIITAGEKLFQDINYMTGFLWDRERDKWATYVYEGSDFYVCATVYGIYFD